MIQRLGLVLLLLLAPMVHAAIDTYEFANDEQRQRFYQLSRELRCPKCQNQDIADSDAPIAMDLRREVYRMLNEGKKDEEIIDFMVARYGDFVRYKPALTPATAILWFGPGVILVGGFVVLLIMLRRRLRETGNTADESMSQDEQVRLQSLLEREEDR